MPEFPKLPLRVSVILSFILTGVLGACVIAAAVLVPRIIGLLAHVYGLGERGVVLLYVCLYALAADALTAVAVLFKLLFNVGAGRVFTASSVACLRAVSWSCVAASVLFGAASVAVRPLLAGTLGALFMGVLLRVVKNVIAAAAELKEENDLTV